MEGTVKEQMNLTNLKFLFLSKTGLFLVPLPYTV